MKWLANTKGSGKNTQLNLLKQIFNEGSLVFNNVVIREVEIAILLLPPKNIIRQRVDKEEKEVRMQGSKLYVGNLSYSVTNEQLEKLFSNYGEVRQANIIEGKGFGFVEMSNQSEAERAKEALNGSEFNGRTLRVNEALPPRKRSRRDYRRY